MRTFAEFFNEVWKDPTTGQPVSPEEYLKILQQRGSNAGNNPIASGVANTQERGAEEQRQKARQMIGVGGRLAPVGDAEIKQTAQQMGGLDINYIIAPSLMVALKGRDPKGGTQHAYPFYRGRDGKVYRFTG